MSLYQEVRLYTNASQREAFDNRAELYSIIKTIQELEVNCPEFINWVGFGSILEIYSDFYSESVYQRCRTSRNLYKSLFKIIDTI